MKNNIIEKKKEEIKYQPYDRGFKNLMTENPSGFLKMIGIDENVKYHLKINMTTSKGQLIMNWAFESLSNELYHLEFQTNTPSIEDIKRFFNYDAELSKENDGKTVNSNIVLGKKASIPNIKNNPYDNIKLPFNFICLNKFDGDKILNNIMNKYNDEITDEDIAKLSCMAMFSTNMDYDEYLIKVANFTKNLKINEKDLDLIMDSQMLFSNMAKEETQIKIVEMYEMKINAVELYGQKKIEEGKLEEKFKIAKNLKNIGISEKDIIKSTGISSKDLKTL